MYVHLYFPYIGICTYLYIYIFIFLMYLNILFNVGAFYYIFSSFTIFPFSFHALTSINTHMRVHTHIHTHSPACISAGFFPSLITTRLQLQRIFFIS